MKVIVMLVILFLFACFIPIVPYDVPLNKGAVIVEHKTIISVMMEHYKEVNTQKPSNHKQPQ